MNAMCPSVHPKGKTVITSILKIAGGPATPIAANFILSCGKHWLVGAFPCTINCSLPAQSMRAVDTVLTALTCMQPCRGTVLPSICHLQGSRAGGCRRQTALALLLAGIRRHLSSGGPGSTQLSRLSPHQTPGAAVAPVQALPRRVAPLCGAAAASSQETTAACGWDAPPVIRAAGADFFTSWQFEKVLLGAGTAVKSSLMMQLSRAEFLEGERSV